MRCASWTRNPPGNPFYAVAIDPNLSKADREETTNSLIVREKIQGIVANLSVYCACGAILAACLGIAIHRNRQNSGSHHLGIGWLAAGICRRGGGLFWDGADSRLACPNDAIGVHGHARGRLSPTQLPGAYWGWHFQRLPASFSSAVENYSWVSVADAWGSGWRCAVSPNHASHSKRIDRPSDRGRHHWLCRGDVNGRGGEYR